MFVNDVTKDETAICSHPNPVPNLTNHPTSPLNPTT